MRLLVLGGTGFVGRAVVDEAVTRGADVTVLNRGRRPPVGGVTALTGDRTVAGGVAALDGRTWDLVVDTWSGAPTVVAAAVAKVTGRAGHYAYVSSRSVYAEGSGAPLTEDAPVVDADPDAEATDYAADKRGGELAAQRFGRDVLLARAGLILGPYEDIGRLPWWLNRIAAGGPTLAPGPKDLPLQYVDARDLAAFLLDAAAAGHTGAYNVVSPSGYATMGSLLDTINEVTGGHADLRWVDPAPILAAGVQPWTDLPVWLPPGDLHAFLHTGDVSRARAAGLRLRPVRDTVADTWDWLVGLGGTPPQRADRPTVGLDHATEQAILAAAEGAGGVRALP